jgi:hypothetical protein
MKGTGTNQMTNRYINTNFWKDNYIADLDPSEKLLFLYLITNPRTNIAGIYELNLREIAFDTGFDVDMVKKILARLRPMESYNILTDGCFCAIGYVTKASIRA